MDENIRIRWTNDALKCFLETCIEEVNKVGRKGSSLQKESWANLGKKLEEACGMKVTQKQMKNQYDYLKGKYSGWVYLRGKTGNLYNPETNTFNLTNQEWEDFYKGHPKAKTLRTSPLLFPDLCSYLFDGTSATGARHWAPSSSRQRSGVSSSSFSPHIQALEIEDIPTDTQEDDDGHSYGQGSAPNVEATNATPSNNEGPSATPSQSGCRPKKKAKTSINLTELHEDMSKALKTLVGTRHAPTIDTCVDKLDTLGLDEMDPIYMAAILFLASHHY